MDSLHQRKLDHLRLCATDDVEHGQHRGLFEEVTLVHDALPERALKDIRTQTPFLRHELPAPLMVTGMTGGPEEAARVNRALARVCARLGLPFGVGSQRVITRDPESLGSFRVKDVAPEVILVGNLGFVQARELGVDKVVALVAAIDADYLAIHLNPAMELVQGGGEGDHDFRGGYDIIEALVAALAGRVIVKECGSGLSPRVVSRLAARGVTAFDVSGSGGTSWTKVEALRAEGETARRGHRFASWGLPTAAATALARRAVPQALIISSGGIRDGLDAAKALALGADLAGLARPVLQSFQQAGEEGAEAFLREVIHDLRVATLLVGCGRTDDLRSAPRVLGPRLQSWLSSGL